MPHPAGRAVCWLGIQVSVMFVVLTKFTFYDHHCITAFDGNTIHCLSFENALDITRLEAGFPGKEEADPVKQPITVDTFSAFIAKSQAILISCSSKSQLSLFTIVRVLKSGLVRMAMTS
jgi:hypothetical protein